MTAGQWERSRDLDEVLRSLDPRVYDRKLRLFAVACCRRIWDLIPNPDARRLVIESESFADDNSAADVLREVSRHVRGGERGDSAARHAAALDCANWRASAECYARAAREATEEVVQTVSYPGNNNWRIIDRRWKETMAQVLLLRDIIGNPFRAIAFAPDWRTSTAVQLARRMYALRDFAALPVLADALQDAGCEEDAVLAHCRDPQGTHVRGCWVIDLVLGKT